MVCKIVSFISLPISGRVSGQPRAFLLSSRKAELKDARAKLHHATGIIGQLVGAVSQRGDRGEDADRHQPGGGGGMKETARDPE